MSKIYEAFEKRHGDIFSPHESEEFDASEGDTAPAGGRRFHERGVDVAAIKDSSDTDAVVSGAVASKSDVRLSDIGLDPTHSVKLESEEADKYFAGHLYSISLDDVRSVSAAIRSALKLNVDESRCIGLIGLGAGKTGSSLVRDLAAYEARLDVKGVLLVDVDRIQGLQNQFYQVPDNNKNFDAARVTSEWQSAVYTDVSPGVNLVSFSTNRFNSHVTVEVDQYSSFLNYCRTEYGLSFFDLPADGLGSETHILGALLDTIILVCPGQIDTAVVNRYLGGLKNSGLRVLGVVTIS